MKVPRSDRNEGPVNTHTTNHALLAATFVTPSGVSPDAASKDSCGKTKVAASSLHSPPSKVSTNALYCSQRLLSASGVSPDAASKDSCGKTKVAASSLYSFIRLFFHSEFRIPNSELPNNTHLTSLLHPRRSNPARI